MVKTPFHRARRPVAPLKSRRDEVSNRACGIMQPFCAFPDVFLLLGISVAPAVRLEEVILNHVHAAFTLLPAELRIDGERHREYTGDPSDRPAELQKGRTETR